MLKTKKKQKRLCLLINVNRFLTLNSFREVLQTIAAFLNEASVCYNIACVSQQQKS